MKLIINDIKMPVGHNEQELAAAVCRRLKISAGDISELNIKRRSIDARKKDEIRIIYSLECDIKHPERFLGNKKYDFVSLPSDKEYVIPKASGRSRPVIAGFGPAGIFCAYICVLAGLQPIVLERGRTVDKRREDVDEFWKTGLLCKDSNVQFGEGGAGAFSDGKLNTLIKDRDGRNRFVLSTLVKFGAPANIIYDAKPHLGTDVLYKVISSMRDYIIQQGADIRFESKLKDIRINAGRVRGVMVVDDNNEYELDTDCLVLAIGHSARDTFELLYDRGVPMEPKPFAVGFRVEHPRSFIDTSQHGVFADRLEAADYKLTAKSSSGRGVYSFCMCPGGYVVDSSSEEGHLCVNGMSYSGRSGDNSNSAVVITVDPSDYPGDDALSGMRFQRDLESRAFMAGSGAVPVERFGEYASGFGYDIVDPGAGFDSDYLPCIKGRYNFADISDILPYDLNLSLIEGIIAFGNKIKGFADPGIYLSGTESRTSSPVRIPRTDTGESVGVYGLYPCGEGAGYAGGITSAAMDGMYIAERIIGRTNS